MMAETGRMVMIAATMLVAAGCASPPTAFSEAFESAQKQAVGCRAQEGQSYYEETVCIETVYKSTVPAGYANWGQLNQTLVNLLKFGRYADRTGMSRKDFDSGITTLWQASSSAQAAELNSLEAERSKAIDQYIEQHNVTGSVPASSGAER